MRQQQDTHRRGHAIGFAQFRAPPAEPRQRTAEQQVERPGERRKAALRDQHRKLKARQPRRRQPHRPRKPLRLGPGVGKRRQHRAQHDEIEPQCEDIDEVRIAREQQQRAPAEPADQSGRPHPRALLAAPRYRQPGGDQPEIERQQRQVRFLAADQRGRGESADQPQHRARQPEAERQRDRACGNQRQPDEGQRLAHQPVLAAREIEPGVERRQPGTRERLAHPRIRDPVLQAIGEFGTRQQQQAERERQPDPHRWRQQTRLDRIAHREHARDRQRHSAAPDRQTPPEDVLEIEFLAPARRRRVGLVPRVEVVGRRLG